MFTVFTRRTTVARRAILCRNAGYNSDDVVLNAMKAYKSAFGNANIPKSFVVPHGDVKFPSESWGMKLGKLVPDITFENVSLKTQQMDPSDMPGFDDIFVAAKAYKTIHGDMEIPEPFIVPDGDTKYPSEVWGLDLGQLFRDPSLSCDYAELEKEYRSIPGNIEIFNSIFPAVVAYDALYGTLEVPEDFIVPENDKNFPSDFWGVPIGSQAINESVDEAVREQEEKRLRQEKWDALVAAAKSKKTTGGDDGK